MTTEQPKVMHALLTVPESPMVPGAIYQTLCGLGYVYQKLTLEDVRTRFVCAACHDAQIEELRRAVNILLERIRTGEA